MTREQQDALADRIAAALNERKRIGAERRLRELEYHRRNSERALARYHRLRHISAERPAPITPPAAAARIADHVPLQPKTLLPQFRSRDRLKEIDAVYAVLLTTSNAAYEFLESTEYESLGLAGSLRG